MEIVKKYKKGKLKGYNIRKSKDGRFHPYKGTKSLSFVGCLNLPAARYYLTNYISGHE